jgi:site-specific DNA-adenine methylase
MYLLQRFKAKKINRIFEPFCGIGGIAIHLSDSFAEYIVNDID